MANGNAQIETKPSRKSKRLLSLLLLFALGVLVSGCRSEKIVAPVLTNVSLLGQPSGSLPLRGIVIHHTQSPAVWHGVRINEARLNDIHRETHPGWRIEWEGRVYYIGYHYVILPDGTVEQGRPEPCPGAHARTYNHWIGIWPGRVVRHQSSAVLSRRPDRRTNDLARRSLRRPDDALPHPRRTCETASGCERNRLSWQPFSLPNNRNRTARVCEHAPRYHSSPARRLQDRETATSSRSQKSLSISIATSATPHNNPTRLSRNLRQIRRITVYVSVHHASIWKICRETQE